MPQSGPFQNISIRRAFVYAFVCENKLPVFHLYFLKQMCIIFPFSGSPIARWASREYEYIKAMACASLHAVVVLVSNGNSHASWGEKIQGMYA